MEHCRECKIEKICKQCTKCERFTCHKCIIDIRDMRGYQIHIFDDIKDNNYNFICEWCYELYFHASIVCKVNNETIFLRSILKLDYYPSEQNIKDHFVQENNDKYDEEELRTTAIVIAYSQLSQKQYRNY